MSRARLFRFGLAVLVGLAVIVASSSLLYLTAPAGEYGFEEQGAVYRENAAWLLTHIVFGAIALATGALQFAALAFFPPCAFHRWAGTVYVVCVTGSCVAGMRLALLAYGGVANAAAFMLLAALWLLTTFQALRLANRGDYEGHRVWMVRSFALTFAAVTLRVETGFLVGIGLSFADAYRIAPWTCWVLNLVFAEWVLLKKRG